MGRLGREILSITDTKKTIFVSGMNTWYDYGTRTYVSFILFINFYAILTCFMFVS